MKAQINVALLLLMPAISQAQVPVDENGNVYGNYESQADIMPIGEDGIPRLSQTELQELVGPIALYPDDLLAVVLPASAYPLQIVEAARFLEALKIDPTLKPDPDWDDSIVALLNYPEVVELLNEDLDWTWRLGEAVVAQQTDVVAAVESFRDLAYAAGNLKSDTYQTVSNDDGVISISPVVEDVIYVPYYEPARVVHYQPRPVYYYYPQPYPVYYYPYAVGHHFDRGFFWGVTTAFSIGWMSDSLHVYHHSYHGHPYFGRTYWNDGWYRRPSIHVHNTTYVSHTNVVVDRHSHGDRWRATDSRREYVRRESYSRARAQHRSPNRTVAQERQHETITFRERDSQTVNRNARRQSSMTRVRDIDRQDAVSRVRNSSRQEAVNRARETGRSQAPSRVREHAPAPAREQALTRTREQAPARTRERAPTRTREQAPARTRENAPTRTREQAPARTREHAPTRTREPAPARTQRAPTPREQPSRSRESRSQESRNSNTRRPERKNNDSRSRSRD